ncbi:MAG: DNA polymerase III subunit chi [Steroidobacteraceae bacterium]
MAQIEFHTLDGESDTARLKLACALIERSFLDGQRVLVWLDDAPQLAAFDNLLWTFGDRSFVPHEPLAADPAACEAPVQLTCAADLPDTLAACFQTLLPLREQASEAALRFGRVIEVVDAEPQRRNAGRARFRFYREHGTQPQHFNAA